MWEWLIERCLGLITEIEGEELLEDYQMRNQSIS